MTAFGGGLRPPLLIAAKKHLALPFKSLDQLIYEIRGQKVMLDRDLAALYGVETKALKRAANRNRARFPSDFMFELTVDEAEAILRSRCQIGTLKRGQNIKYLPFAFTEQGVATLSSVLSGVDRARQMFQSSSMQYHIKLMHLGKPFHQAVHHG